MAETVGLVGVGKMGLALLRPLMKAGFAVRCRDVSPAAQAAAEAAGAIPVASPAEAARGCRVVHLFTATDEQVEEVLTGPDGVFSVTAPGVLVVIHSTILPETTQAVAKAAPPGVMVVDAPCTDVPQVLAEGRATFLLGGADDAAALARDHLLPLGRDVCHFGPLGSGNVAKIAKNLANVVERVVVAETMQLVEAAGLDPLKFLRMAKEASDHGVWAHWERRLVVEGGRALPKPASGLVNKDIRHAVALSAGLGLDLPVAKATEEAAGRLAAGWRAAAAKA